VELPPLPDVPLLLALPLLLPPPPLLLALAPPPLLVLPLLADPLVLLDPESPQAACVSIAVEKSKRRGKCARIGRSLRPLVEKQVSSPGQGSNRALGIRQEL
jgi:hypothetical protein